MSFHDKARHEAAEAAREMDEYRQQNIVQPLLAELEDALDAWFEEVEMLPKPSTHFIKHYTEFVESSSNYAQTPDEHQDYVMVGWNFEGYDYQATYGPPGLSVSILVNSFWRSANTLLEIGNAVLQAGDQLQVPPTWPRGLPSLLLCGPAALNVSAHLEYSSV